MAQCNMVYHNRLVFFSSEKTYICCEKELCEIRSHVLDLFKFKYHHCLGGVMKYPFPIYLDVIMYDFAT